MSKPAKSISPFWFRRLAEGTILLGLALSIIYTVASLVQDPALPVLVPTQAVTIGSIAALIGLIARLIPHPKHVAPWAWVVFIANTATIVGLMTATGGPDSPLGALWLLTALSTGIIGLAGVIALSILGAVYIAVALTVGWWSVPAEQIVFLYLASQLPLAVGLLFWKTGIFGEPHAPDDATINHLTERLSREANKSEIIVKFIADGVLVIDKKGLVQLINPAAQQLTGWEEKEALQLDYSSV